MEPNKTDYFVLFWFHELNHTKTSITFSISYHANSFSSVLLLTYQAQPVYFNTVLKPIYIQESCVQNCQLNTTTYNQGFIKS